MSPDHVIIGGLQAEIPYMQGAWKQIIQAFYQAG